MLKIKFKIPVFRNSISIFQCSLIEHVFLQSKMSVKTEYRKVVRGTYPTTIRTVGYFNVIQGWYLTKKNRMDGLRAGHFRYFLIFSLIKNEFIALLDKKMQIIIFYY